jgi:hypothetical protein
MEVHFGNLLDGHGRDLRTRNSLDMPTTIPIIGEIVSMSERGMIETERPLLVEGETKGFLSGSFSREIYSLAWSFETQGVDADGTQANWTLLSYTYFAELMEEHGRDIADVLGLRRFYDLDARSRNLIGLQENKPQDAAIDSEHGGKEGDQR